MKPLKTVVLAIVLGGSLPVFAQETDEDFEDPTYTSGSIEPVVEDIDDDAILAAVLAIWATGRVAGLHVLASTHRQRSRIVRGLALRSITQAHKPPHLHSSHEGLHPLRGARRREPPANAQDHAPEKMGNGPL